MSEVLSRDQWCQLRLRFHPEAMPARRVCTQGVLFADYLKSILTGHNLTADLAQEAQNSPFYKQDDPGAPHWVLNPNRLPNSNLVNAFTPE